MQGVLLWSGLVIADLFVLAFLWRRPGPWPFVIPAVVVTILLHIFMAATDRAGEWLMWLPISAGVVFGVLFTVNVAAGALFKFGRDGSGS